MLEMLAQLSLYKVTCEGLFSSYTQHSALPSPHPPHDLSHACFYITLNQVTEPIHFNEPGQVLKTTDVPVFPVLWSH